MRFLLLSPLLVNPVIKFSNSNALLGLGFQLYPRHSRYLRSPITMASAKPKPAAAVNKFPVEEECVGIARKCWIKFKRESTFALYTPFVVSLASGTLNLDTFRHYIAQDVHFLKSFAQASVLHFLFFK